MTREEFIRKHVPHMQGTTPHEAIADLEKVVAAEVESVEEDRDRWYQEYQFHKHDDLREGLLAWARNAAKRIVTSDCSSPGCAICREEKSLLSRAYELGLLEDKR